MERIIKCLVVDDEVVARDILRDYISRVDSLELIGSCKDALDAFSYITRESIDLVFLDINMPEISGLSFARSLNQGVKIIFTTAYREYAVDGFDLQAVDYLLKPISFERFLQAVNRYLGETNDSSQPNEVQPMMQDRYFFVRADRKMVKVVFDEIRYIESIGDYVKLFLDEKTVVTRETISGIEAKLPKKEFLRIHRSFIVSVAAITSYTNETIELEGKELPVSRGYKDQVLRFLENGD